MGSCQCVIGGFCLVTFVKPAFHRCTKDLKHRYNEKRRIGKLLQLPMNLDIESVIHLGGLMVQVDEEFIMALGN